MPGKPESHAHRWAALRQRAERLAGASRADIAHMPAGDVQSLVHELQLYQTELELQNEELRQTQLQLETVSDRYRDLFEHAPVGYLTHDARGAIREANLTAAALLGVDRAALVRTVLSDFIVSEDQDIWYLHRRRLTETAGRQTSEIRFRQPAGGSMYLQLESIALNEGGPIAEYRTSLIDGSDRRRAQDSLREAHDDLEARVTARTAGLSAAHARLQQEIKERARGEQREKQLLADLAHVARVQTMEEMATSLAHELNQPLGAMVAEADAARHRLGPDDGPHAAQLRASLEFISEQALRAGELVRRIRQFAKRSTPQKTLLCLSDVVGEVVPLIQQDIRESETTLLIDLPPELPHVFADKIQVQQVVLNLLRNAIEAMETTNGAPRQLTIRATALPDEVEVACCDTGCGLPAEHADKPGSLFDGFFTTKPNGMGLGLAISRSILDAHGGKLVARQNPERGATFSFTLPIIEERRTGGN